MLDGGPREASALALEPTTLLVVPRAPWFALIESEPALALRVFSAFGAALRRYVGHVLESLFLDVEVPEAPPLQSEGVARFGVTWTYGRVCFPRVTRGARPVSPPARLPAATAGDQLAELPQDEQHQGGKRPRSAIAGR